MSAREPIGGNLSLFSSIHEKDVPLDKEAQQRYINYAMSVITSRALPDVRDGLKPVQRRILYAMFHDQRLLPDAKYRKCASVVGEVLGKYHPHGDSSVYDALARMAQAFSLRYPFIDGYGNFGSQDGDAPAAYRYTECRLRPYATYLLEELPQHTVDYRPSFDGTRTEPVVLPAQLPNLLLNGTQGIAVGMATAIPPHNAHEILDACLHLIKHPDTDTKTLVSMIRGPDFPTGGILLCTEEDLITIYEKGQGSLLLQADYRIETPSSKKGNPSVVIHSIPYGVPRASIMEQVGKLIEEKRLPHVLACRDESTADTRIVLEIKADTDPALTMAYLYQHTQLRIYIQFNLTCLVPLKNSEGCEPKKLSLLDCLRHFLDFRFEVVTRRLRFELKVLLARIHILNGFILIYDELDEVIRLIRASKNKVEAGKVLRNRFPLDEEQTSAILETKLYQLAKFEIDSIRNELDRKERERQKLEGLLAKDEPRWKLIHKELTALYGTLSEQRLTKVSTALPKQPVDSHLFIPEEDAYLVATSQGWVKRIQSVRDVESIRVHEGDTVETIIFGSLRSTLLFFTNFGFAYGIRLFEVPSSTGYGEPVQRMFSFQDQEKIVSVVSFDPRNKPKEEQLIAITKQGIGLRSEWSLYKPEGTRFRKRFFKLEPGDELLGVADASEQANLVIVTKKGSVVYLSGNQVKKLQRLGQGGTLGTLDAHDEVVAFSVNRPCTVEDETGKPYTVSPKTKKQKNEPTKETRKKSLAKGRIFRIAKKPVQIPMIS